MRKIFIGVIVGFLTILSAFAQENLTYGPTKVNEGLWSIASGMNQSSDISIAQIMLAILHKNTQAFSIPNVNALEPGSTITYPSLAEINAIPKNKAYTEIEKQNKAWQHITNKDSKPIIAHKINKTYKSKSYANKQHKNTKKTTVVFMHNTLAEQKSAPLLSQALTIDKVTDNTETTKLNDQIKTVAEKNNIMQAQLDQINTRVIFVEKSTNKLLKFDITNIFKPLSRYTQADAVVASCVISSSALLLFIIISLLIQLFKKNPIFNSSKEEYGIITNKEEENIAKLNLARAYIDMGKNDEARVILNEVITHGDPVEKAEAQGLLAKIAQG